MQAYNLDKPLTNIHIEVGAYSTSSHTLHEKYEIKQRRTQTPWKTGWSTEEFELEVQSIPFIVSDGPNTKEKLHFRSAYNFEFEIFIYKWQPS